MFHCYLHGWSSSYSMCPACPTTLSGSKICIDKDAKDKEIAILKEEVERLNKRLKSYTEENSPWFEEYIIKEDEEE